MKDQMLQQIAAIEAERQKLNLGGGPKEVAKQHKKGLLTARERVQRLMDDGTFHELELWSKPIRTGFELDERDLPADAVVIGYGKVNGRTVLVYSEDYSVAAGTQSAVHIDKMTRVMDSAVRMGVPYVGIVDSGGVRMQSTMGEPGNKPACGGTGTGDSGSFMFSPPWASGVVPRISIMLGPNYAGSSYSPIMADFLIMRKGAYMSLASPSVIKQITGETATQEEIGGTYLHAAVSNTCDIIRSTDEECLDTCRELLGFLPSNNREKTPVAQTKDDPNRRCEDMLDLVPAAADLRYDMYKVIAQIVDEGDFFEIKPVSGRSVITGFARLNGQSVGIVASNPKIMGGAVDYDSADKEARFIRGCDAFNIPLIFLVDTDGFVADPAQEMKGIERHAAKILYAICEATVPKITLHIGKCRNAGELAMSTRAMGTDLSLTWPMAEARYVDPAEAVEKIYADEIKKAKDKDAFRAEKIEEVDAKYNSVIHAGALQLIDDIIDPRDTRKILIEALDWFEGKNESRPWKKHGNIPL